MRACLTAGCCAVLAACADPLDPEELDHAFTGTIVSTLPLTARPFGVAVSNGDIVYVTRLDSPWMARIDLPAAVFSDSVEVGSAATAVAFNPVGSTAYVANQWSQNVGVVDVSTGLQSRNLPTAGDPFMVAVSPDGIRLYATTNLDSVLAFDASSHTRVAGWHVAGAPNGVAFHPTEDRVYVSAFVGGTVTEIAGGVASRVFQCGGAPQGLASSLDGNELFVANEAGPLQVVDIASGSVASIDGVADNGFGVALSRGGTRLYVSVPSMGRVISIDLSTRERDKVIGTGGDPRRVTFDAAGKTMVVANQAGWVDIIR